MNENIPTSEVLNRAADLIEERGWYSVGGNRTTPWQANPWGSIDSSSDAFCMEGGIAAAAGLRVQAGSVAETLQAKCPAFGAVCDYLGTRPAEYNDAPDRTASEVIEVLRATAVIEAARENDRAEVTA